jgi:hypothetical protein
MRIAPNRYHRLGAQGVQQPSQQRPASFALFSRMATIRHWIVRSVGVEWEDIPQKDRTLQLFDHGPDHSRSPLADRRPLRRSRQLWRFEKRGVLGKVNFVCESETCAAPASVTKIAGDPDGIYVGFQRSPENDLQIATANGRGIRAVVPITRVGVGVESSVEFQCGNVPDKVINSHSVVVHSNRHLLVRSQGEIEELSPDFLKNPVRWGRSSDGEPQIAQTRCSWKERTRFEDGDGRGQNAWVILPVPRNCCPFRESRLTRRQWP